MKNTKEIKITKGNTDWRTFRELTQNVKRLFRNRKQQNKGKKQSEELLESIRGIGRQQKEMNAICYFTLSLDCQIQL